VLRDGSGYRKPDRSSCRASAPTVGTSPSVASPLCAASGEPAARDDTRLCARFSLVSCELTHCVWRLRRPFTGIVQGQARVVSFDSQPGFATLRAAFPAGSVDSVAIGASVALNGTCLTVTSQPQPDELCFDLIVETLRATNLGELRAGDLVNFERSARLGDEVGGHHVSGHVHTTAVVEQLEDTPGNRRLHFAVPAEFMKYILPKARACGPCPAP